MFSMNKKGAEMTIGTIVMIILALVVLVVLIFGFTSGWSNLWQNILGFGGGQVNVQTVVQACQVACSTSSNYDYCTRERSVVFEKGADPQSLRCTDLEARGVGLSACGNVDCSGSGTSVTGKTCTQWRGTWKDICETSANEFDIKEVKSGQGKTTDGVNLILESDRNANPNKACCFIKTDCPNNRWSAKDASCAPNQYDINTLVKDIQVNGHVDQRCCSS